MDNSTLTEYVKTESSQGLPPKMIYQKSLSSGWSKEAIAKSFSEVYGNKIDVWDFMIGSFKDLVEESVKFFVSNSKLLLTIGIIPGIIAVLFWVVEIVMYPRVTYIDLPFWYRLSTRIILGISQFLVTMTLTYAIININDGLNLKTAIAGAFSRIWKFIVTSTIETILIGLGAIALFVPGLVVAVYSIFSVYLVYDENLSGIKAIKGSVYYVKGYFLKVAARLFAIGVFIGLLNSTAGLALGLMNLLILDRPLSALLSALVMIIFQIYVYLLYKKIKEVKTVLSKPTV